MKVYRVTFNEIHEVVMEVEATSEHDAKERVADGEGREISNDSLDSQNWNYPRWGAKEVGEVV